MRGLQPAACGVRGARGGVVPVAARPVTEARPVIEACPAIKARAAIKPRPAISPD
ncbi:hypothetical protein [Pseudooceanicola nanhaiensis]|uniref:hypothetical protein n=1 Tax=Pseudooceanicola nanhaiensis TaxID=375761 RepID=UPI001CD2DC5D|nr:hypothetical protein [Pseudooceanicola nanhaiensis]MCA0920658.1 hypothetical protein [Pseudooceanicola nanhaiensis]